MLNVLPELVAATMVAPNAHGLEYLGGFSGTNVGNGKDVSILARDSFMVHVAWQFTGNGKMGMRFNGDFAANYTSRVFHAGEIIGQLSFANAPVPSGTTLDLSDDNFGNPGHAIMFVANRSASHKLAFWQTTQSSGNLTQVAKLRMGAGSWINTTSQITTLRFLDSTGLNDWGFLNVAVYGRNFP